MPEIDYQEIVNLVATILKIGLPIGVIFNIGKWVFLFFLECAFPRFYKKG